MLHFEIRKELLCGSAKLPKIHTLRGTTHKRKKDTLDNLEAVSDGKNIEEAFVQKELSQKALMCLHKLEEPYKEVFMLSVFGGFSLKDISLIFEKSESWARVTFYRAKQKLLERMR